MGFIGVALFSSIKIHQRNSSEKDRSFFATYLAILSCHEYYKNSTREGNYASNQYASHHKMKIQLMDATTLESPPNVQKEVRATRITLFANIEFRHTYQSRWELKAYLGRVYHDVKREALQRDIGLETLGCFGRAIAYIEL